MWLRHLIENHVLTNLVFLLVLVIGGVVYLQLPREQDPTINFNWVQVTTFYPGATARNVERKVTDPIEEVLERVQDIKFVSSTSREGLSSILVRFHDLSERDFDKRLADLRREINGVESRLPIEVEAPSIFEVTTANAYPTATVVVSAPDNDDNLRAQARALERELARLPGVDQVQPSGLHNPELQIRFYPEKMALLGISPTTIADTVRRFSQDISAGTVRMAEDQWIVSLDGALTDPQQLAQLPLMVAGDREILIHEISEVTEAREKADRLVRFEGRPAVLLAVMKRQDINTLDLVERIQSFIAERNTFAVERGVEITLVDDQTEITRTALSVMQTNALFGLFFVLIVTWLFLGSKISILVTIGIPFTLAGTFIALKLFDQTLNTSVLLAIVISLGMLVDDAVVVVESIHYKIRQGVQGITASWQGLTTVIRPVTASVLTTMAAFLPLMLLPGILGKFMFVIPLVVTTALAVSLIEAYWMLPGHILMTNVSYHEPTRAEKIRQRSIAWLRRVYSRALVRVMRHPKKTLTLALLLFTLPGVAIQSGLLRMDFFASDTLRIFYINVTMPPSSSLDDTMEKTVEIERRAREAFLPDEARSIVSLAGQAFTETAPVFGDNVGQIMVSLMPKNDQSRSVADIVDATKAAVGEVVGADEVSFLTISGGPPTSKAISLKVRGDRFEEIRGATDAIKAFMQADGRYLNVTDDDSLGRKGMILTINMDAINRTGIDPSLVQRSIKMLVDGEIVQQTQNEGDLLATRVVAKREGENELQDIDALLSITLPSPAGEAIALSELVDYRVEPIKSNIRHYNFMRTITIESDLDKEQIDTVQANELIKAQWQTIGALYPNVNLDFSGELDDIQESLGAMGLLFLFGLGLIYLILSTQFQSYFQPLMILATIPLAFTGVTIGLIVANQPLSLFTLYGIVALAGIAVNAAIVLISTANSYFNSGMTALHATFFAARRRMLPIVITTLTTVAGLFSLAVGLGGHSLVWSPVAIAIVWGLLFSSLLTLFVIPLLYQMSMQRR